MIIIRSKKELEAYVRMAKKSGRSIGFAPTMGALHAGHLSLYEAARPENDLVISSIFVNPTQFNNIEDFEKYPNTLESDIETLTKSNLVDVLYLPSVTDLYPNDTVSKHYDLGILESVMEGKFRPGHFQGVATVVEELFSQTQPDRAYFGEKDFQQIAVIKKMTDLIKSPVKINSVPTVREQNGLAMSSRNLRLSKEGKKRASLIWKILSAVPYLLTKHTIDEITDIVTQTINNEEDMHLEYFTIANSETLIPASKIEDGKNYRAFIVVLLENIRLIDNMEIKN